MKRRLLTLACLLSGFYELVSPIKAAVFVSSEYYCQVTLPDGSYVQPWYTMVPANERGVLTGARRQDYVAMVYLGVVDMKDKPNFALAEKSWEQPQRSFFAPV